jgi:hypothetical protein
MRRKSSLGFVRLSFCFGGDASGIAWSRPQDCAISRTVNKLV